MCVVAAKYLKGFGWVGIKNRDRNYKPQINFRKSDKGGVERLYIWDETTRYSDGMNEYGVSIISASLMTKKDENEASDGEDQNKSYYSPDGRRVREALLEKTVDKALEKLIKTHHHGNTLVFDKDNCFILEGIDRHGDFHYAVKRIPKTQTIVRSNHGILIPYAGYQNDSSDPKQELSRMSSEYRLKTVERGIGKCETEQDLLNLLLSRNNKNPQLNPCRIDEKRGSIRTTGQIMIVPSEHMLYYRPVWCDVIFDYPKLNKDGTKLYFELLSMKPLLNNK